MAYQKLQPERAIEVINDNVNPIFRPTCLVLSSNTGVEHDPPTSDQTGILTDPNASFLTTLKVGDVVRNASTFARQGIVTAINSDTEAAIQITSGQNPNVALLKDGTSYRVYRPSVEAPQRGCILYIGSAGNLDVETAGGDRIVFKGVLGGSYTPVQVVRLFSTGTTVNAGNIIALW
jgi:hypothetical protein